jgi:hypothetical protein
MRLEVLRARSERSPTFMVTFAASGFFSRILRSEGALRQNQPTHQPVDA